MPPFPEPNKPKDSRPWWTGSRPAWKSPWSLEEDEPDQDEEGVKAPDAQPVSDGTVEKPIAPSPFSVRPVEASPVERAVVVMA